MTNKVAFLLVFALLIFKIIAIYFTKFTLYGDEAQYWIWSKTLDLGYFSKPPLLAWFLSGYISAFNDSFFSLKIFPIVVYCFTSFAIYRLCLCLSLSKKNSALCSISFLIMPAVSLSSFLISTDLLLLLFWVISTTKLLNIRDNGSVLNFFLLGLFLGLAFLAKYAAIYFVICLILLIILDKKTLSVFKNNLMGVFVFFGSLVLVLLPNIIWNLNNGWVTFVHTSDNANLNNLTLNLYNPLIFLSSQILMVGPVLFFAFVLLTKNFNLSFENKFLLIFSIPIIFIVLLESFLVRANANWAAPALISVFILFFRLVNEKRPHLIEINFLFNFFIAMLLFGSIMFSSKNKAFDRIRGMDNFVKEVIKTINDKDLVVSDRIIFSSLSYAIQKKQNILYMPYEFGKPITNHFQMTSALSGDRKNNFYLIGEMNDVSYLSKAHEGRLIKEFVVPFSSTNLKLYEVSIK